MIDGKILLSGCEKGAEKVIKTEQFCKNQACLIRGFRIVALLRCLFSERDLLFWASQECAQFLFWDAGNSNVDRMWDTPGYSP